MSIPCSSLAYPLLNHLCLTRDLLDPSKSTPLHPIGFVGTPQREGLNRNTSNWLLPRAEVDTEKDVLRVLREVALLNPTVVARVATENICHALPFVFAEIEYLYALVVVSNTPCEVSETHISCRVGG